MIRGAKKESALGRSDAIDSVEKTGQSDPGIILRITFLLCLVLRFLWVFLFVHSRFSLRILALGLFTIGEGAITTTYLSVPCSP